MKAFYGFSPDLAPFVGRSPAEQAALLRQWGATAIFGGYENLAFIEAVHGEGMQIYAEFPCFVGQEWWEKVPASRPLTATGELLAPIHWYHGVNPTVPAVRQQRLAALTALLSSYPIDGVWLDFIRWPCHWEKPTPLLQQSSFDQATVVRFAADVGLELDPQADAASLILSDYANEWTQWKCEQITTWVAEARQVVDALRPGLQLGLFAVPWREMDLQGAIHTIIGQDFAALAPYIDCFSPMTYHRLCDKPVAWIGEVVTAMSQATRRPICPVIQSIDQPTTLPTAEYAASLALAQHAAGAAGIIIFTLAGLLTGDKLAATQAAWAATGR
ncbi:MAG: hypothetical protein KF832_13630 [Caldilineaceae bacterium]|nr:hypothetical protein [Caldilineaceae bacterium]